MKHIAILVITSAVCFSVLGCSSQNSVNSGSGSDEKEITGVWVNGDDFAKDHAFFLADATAASFYCQ